jgi:hypothetical protein
VFLTTQRLHGADAIEVEASDFRCGSVVLRHVCDLDRLASTCFISATAIVV